MPEKLGNGGNGPENYDPETGRYVKEGEATGSNSGTIGSQTISDNIKKITEKNNAQGSERDLAAIQEKIKNMDLKKVLEAVTKTRELKKSENYDAPFNKKNREWALSEDILAVNPNHNKYTNRIDYTHNCQRCAPTFVARMAWGLDVEVNTVEDKSKGYARADYINPWSLNTLYSVYEGAKPVFHYGRHGNGPQRKESWDELDNFMSDMPDGAIVQVSVEGHTFPVYRKNGRNYCVEPQAPEYYQGKDINEAMNEVDKGHRSKYTIDSYCRVDNLKPSRRFWDVCHNREEEKPNE